MHTWTLSVTLCRLFEPVLPFSKLDFSNIGALKIRIGFGGPLNYNYNNEPPKIVLVVIWAPILSLKTRAFWVSAFRV